MVSQLGTAQVGIPEIQESSNDASAIVECGCLVGYFVLHIATAHEDQIKKRFPPSPVRRVRRHIRSLHPCRRMRHQVVHLFLQLRCMPADLEQVARTEQR
eukprot:4891255-Alexandrium_andersonii.AAC.1